MLDSFDARLIWKLVKAIYIPSTTAESLLPSKYFVVDQYKCSLDKSYKRVKTIYDFQQRYVIYDESLQYQVVSYMYKFN